MRNTTALTLAIFSGWILFSTEVSADSLISTVKQQIRFSTFDKTRMDAHFSLVVSTPNSKAFYAREDVENFHASAEAKHLVYGIRHFKILSLDE